MKVAAYYRVSDEDLNAANQHRDVERLCQARGWTIERVYTDVVSGAAERREDWSRMMADAQRGEFGAVVVWAMDRFGRGGVAAISDAVGRLDRAGVALVSVQEPWLDTASPVRELLIAIFAWVAKQERTRLIERTRAGLKRAEAEGVVFGRPPAMPSALRRAAEVLKAGGKMADALKATEYTGDDGKPRRLSVSTLYRYGVVPKRKSKGGKT